MKRVTVKFSPLSARAPLVVVPAWVNGDGPCRFLVDTGASHSVVAPSVVARLGLRVGGRATALAAGGSMKLELARIESLAVGGARVGKLVVAVVEISHVARLVRGVEGVVGNDFLKNFVVTINYAKGTVTLR